MHAHSFKNLSENLGTRKKTRGIRLSEAGLRHFIGLPPVVPSFLVNDVIVLLYG